MEWGDPEIEVVFNMKLPTLGDATRQLIREAMRRAAGDKTTAAELLGVTKEAIERGLCGENSE